MLQYLLNLTRHTPRDLLRLFEEIRKVDASGQFDHAADGTLSQEVIREGVLQYATKYFVGAIRNEFAGYEGGPDEAELGLVALQSIRAQYFDRKKFTKALSAEGRPEPDLTRELLSLLFFAGAIGNSVAIEGGSYMQFYHRREDINVYLGGSLLVHNALCHAWAIPFGRGMAELQEPNNSIEGTQVRAASNKKLPEARRKRTRTRRS